MGAIGAWLVCTVVWAGEALPEFAYQNLTVRFVRSGGTPVAGASVYGFCREYNLIWPRNDEDFSERSSPLWQQSFVAKTEKDGTAAVKVPPGQWGFFAVGRTDNGAVIAGWTEFKRRNANEKIQIEAPVIRRWSFSRAHAGSLKPTTVLLKPESFPIWMPVQLDSKSDPGQMELGAGSFRMWVTKGATTLSPGFVLDCGALSEKTPDGMISVAPQAATFICKGGHGSARLHWSRRQCFGLEGDVAVADGAKVLVSPGPTLVGYQRPLADAVTGVFGAELYSLQNGQIISLDLGSPLAEAIDQALPDSNDKHGAGQILACLYLADANGHLLGEMRDPANKTISFEATVTVAGQHLTATHLAKNSSSLNETIFAADLGSMRIDPSLASQAVWEIAAPAGVLQNSRLTETPAVPVSSATFRTEVQQIVVPHTKNLLAQAELEASAMEQISGRRRHRMPTLLNFKPQGGASAGHNGLQINIGSGVLFTDDLIDSHTFAHELGHGFDFYHGGLHESVVELTRTTSGQLNNQAWQISQQAGKWFFFDRMNGKHGKEHWYHNTGLYLFFYAQAGPDFLHFMSLNEHAILTKLEKENYTTDEATTALCNIAMKRDVSEICRYYGLKAEPDRVTRATAAARGLMR
jgi:hypothetical protein